LFSHFWSFRISQILDLFYKNYKAVCVNSTTLKMDRGGFRTPLFGRSCDDDFCSVNSRCISQEILAFCCL
uniref:BPTI/Kunitz inhibitor domain-containing protein n=1 Tax=Parascaris univalens TaxID=6257 RepID=A0A915AR11_PARUN